MSRFILSLFFVLFLALSTEAKECNGDCGQGEGDCEHDNDCIAGLVCMKGEDKCIAGPNTVNYSWKGWREWSDCSKTCGGGTRARSRKCNPPQNGGYPCPSSKDVETESCNEEACKVAVDGGWSAWGDFTKCDAECGGGSQNRWRICNNPKPANGGKYCVGEEKETKACNEEKCSGGDSSGGSTTKDDDTCPTLCAIWFDGCNMCFCNSGKLTFCYDTNKCGVDEKEDKKCLYKHLPSGKRLEFVGDNENWLLEALQESAVEETMTGGYAAPPQMSGDRRVENDEAPVDTDGEGVKTDEDNGGGSNKSRRLVQTVGHGKPKPLIDSSEQNIILRTQQKDA